MPSTITDRLYGENSSVAIKAPVVAVSSANIALSGLGAFTTPSGSYTPNEGDRVLCIGQQDQTANGIYNASATAWERTGDFDGAYDVTEGTLVVAFLPNTQTLFYQLTTVDPIIGTSALTFSALWQTNQNIPQTPQEATAGIVPTNTSYPYGYVERYGADPTGINDSGPAFRTACTLMNSAGGGKIFALGKIYLFNTWDAVSFQSANNLALFCLGAGTELLGGGQFYTKLRIGQAARTGMYAAGANRTHIIGMRAGQTGQYVHDIQFDYDGIVQAANNDFCYFVRTMSGGCIFERCYGTQAPITNAIVDSSGNTGLPVIVRDCWFQDCGPNMTGNSALNGDCSYVYLNAPGSRFERNRCFNTAIASHNCGGVEMHCQNYYVVENFLKNCWPGMYLGVQDGVTVSVGSVVERNYVGYSNGGIEIVDQHEGLKIKGNYFEANCDSAGSPNGFTFNDLYTPLNGSNGTNTAGTQTALSITDNTFDMTLYRQGTARSTAGTAAQQTTAINISALLGASIRLNKFLGASPSAVVINGSVTAAAEGIAIEDNQLVNCTDIAGSVGFFLVLMSSAAGYASGPAARDVFIRRNYLHRSVSFARSNAMVALAVAGGSGPAGILTNIQVEDNDCDNINNAISTLASLTGVGQVAFNGKDQDPVALTANGQTISTTFKKVRVTSGAAFTGLIMQPGTYDGQECTVVNENAFAQTMAAFATSNVAMGATCVIPASGSMRFVWNTAAGSWYANL